jgi:hypothetical protein
MKKLIKKLGRCFIALTPTDENKLRQSVLLIEGSFILPNNFALIIRNTKEKFKNARLVVLAFKEKKEFIQDNFPDVELIIPEEKAKLKKYRLAIKLFFLLCRRFSFVVLSSLDISTLVVALIFGRCPIYLHNRWLEWYRIRQRTLLDILCRRQSADAEQRIRHKGIKVLLKSLGRMFVILTQVNDKDLKSRILIVDNGYTEIGPVLTAIKKAESNFVNPKLTILTLSKRKEDLLNNFPYLKEDIIGQNNRGFSLGWGILRMGNYQFTHILLTALDIWPILSAFLYRKAKILLYNQWHQWWTLKPRNIFGYIREILVFLVMIPVFIYLSIASIFILLRTNIRLVLLKSERSQ